MFQPREPTFIIRMCVGTTGTFKTKIKSSEIFTLQVHILTEKIHRLVFGSGSPLVNLMYDVPGPYQRVI